MGLILTPTSDSKAQTYVTFPDTNAIWNYANYHTYSPDKTIQIFISGDSMIGDTNYHKLFVSYDQDSMPNSQMFFSYSLIREDSFKKVFFRDQYGDRILYDFSLSIGDSINYTFAGYTLFITDIDSVLILNKYRKRFLNNSGEYWIEGIGSLQGLTLNAYPHLGDDIYLRELVCFTENDTLKYLNSNYTTCYPIITGISENDLQDETEINIYPNPCNDCFTIYARGDNFKNAEIRVINVSGELIFCEKVNTAIQQKNICLKDISRSVYTVQIISNSGTFIKKLIVD